MPTAGNHERAVKTLLCFLICLPTPTLELLASTGRGIITIRYSGLHCVEAARCLELFSNHKRPVTPNLNQSGILRNNSLICLKGEPCTHLFKPPFLTRHGGTRRHEHTLRTPGVSVFEVSFRRPGERRGSGFVGQHRSSLVCRRKYSQRHLMTINNIERETGRGLGEGGRSALVHKQGNGLNFKADALQDKQRCSGQN